MSGLCLGLAFHLVYARLPGDRFTLAWTHSVEQTGWEEDYRVSETGIELLGARVEGSGAGMEPPPNAVLRQGRWHYRASLPPLSKLTLARSRHTSGYRICRGQRCESLSALLGPPPAEGATVDLFPCPASAANGVR